MTIKEILFEKKYTKTSGVIFLNDRTAIVGITHGQKLELSPDTAKKVKAIADKYGAWYEGNGVDKNNTPGIIDEYRGSWDDDLLNKSIKGYPYEFLYVLFANIKEEDTIHGKIGFDPSVSIFDRILNTQPSTNYFVDRRFTADDLTKFLEAVSDKKHDFIEMSKWRATEENVTKFFELGSKLSWPNNRWHLYPYNAGKVAKKANLVRDKFLASRESGVYVTGGGHLIAISELSKKQPVDEGKLGSDLDYIGNCTQDDVIEELFGDVTNFAQAVENHGDEFIIDNLVVKYDPDTDIHSFYYKDSSITEGKHTGGLTKWFKEKWVNIAKKEGGKHPPCGTSGKKRGYAKCVPAKKAASMSTKEKKSAVNRKRSAQRKAGRPGKDSGGTGKKPIRVKTDKD